ncbi:phosphate regulon sensor histidine kinase PhoR [Caenimonas sedimenti]|uniref:Phosphate regulon sensor protein PhoR n=1 Tax=Caenimonas sedimenti TaxID=2596921 RepID=A0A562ZTN5_9BURK|nr:phosphate regulon sensor histidine kinase PhoR [Caenimonas sedimenti]TWO71970.1 phosphate regulon sensor histidine kinase PhoR [Caenimonas sedimenti]
MLARLATFLICLVAGGGTGWWLGGDRGAELGLVAGAVGWFTLETLRAMRVLRWLRAGQFQSAPRVGGLWGDAADRVRRAVTLRERDVTEARDRLEEFLGAIRGSPNGVVLLDARGRIEWCNETAAEQFGLDPERDLQQNIINLVRDPDFSAYHQGRDFSSDLIVAAPGSTPARPVKLSLRLHPYGEGRLLLLSRDVTAMEQAEIMRRDFVANVSHEIRTPLTVLAGFVETLQTLDLPGDERSRYLRLMAQQAQRMQTLVSDLLTLSRLEGSPLPGGGEWTHATVLSAQCEEEARALLATLGKSLTLRFEADRTLEIAGVPSEWQSAMSNLVTNAVRYTPDGGSVAVRCGLVADGRAEFSVRDTGPGIAPEHVPRLTERFYRIDRSRSRETGGTGLGLAIVKHVVQRHGAELRIDSRVGTGSTFSILYPPARVRGGAPFRPADTPARPATESTAG